MRGAYEDVKQKYEEAEEIGRNFRYNDTIQSQIITIRIKQAQDAKMRGDYEDVKQKYEEAEEIGKKFKYNDTIQSQIITIKMRTS